MLFLIEYDRKAAKIVEMRTYEDSARQDAFANRLERELKLSRASVDHEVIVLEAANEAVIRKTHRRYFATLQELATLPDHMQ